MTYPICLEKPSMNIVGAKSPKWILRMDRIFGSCVIKHESMGFSFYLETGGKMLLWARRAPFL